MDSFCFFSDDDDAGARLDVFVAENAESISRSRIKTLCDEKQVIVNGKAQKAGYTLRAGDKVELQLPPLETLDVEAEDIPLDIVYEDDSLAVINKEQGMVVHPAVGNANGTLVNALLFRLDSLSGINGVIRPGIVHRLDKETSGLMVVAKTDEAHKKLAEAIALRNVKRCYIGLVDGNIKEDGGTIDAPIGRSLKDRKKMAVVSGGRQAVTDYTALERFGKYTLVEFRLHTGRTHQIRVHCKYIHHPIAGDEVYGGSNAFKQRGQLLHSYKLSFAHPITGNEMTFFAPLPQHFVAVLNKLDSKYEIKM